MKTSLRHIILVIVISTFTACVKDINLPDGVLLFGNIETDYMDYLLWSPDGTNIASGYQITWMPDIPTFGIGTPYSEIVIIDPQTGSIKSLLREEQAYFRVVEWSEDGQRIKILSERSSFGDGYFWIDLSDSVPEFLGELENAPYRYFNYDNSQYVFHDQDGGITLGDTRTGNERAILVLDKSSSWVDWSPLSWSPDNKFLFSYSQKDPTSGQFKNMNVYMMDTTTGESWQVTDNYTDNYSATFSPDGNKFAYIYSTTIDNAMERKIAISTVDGSCEWSLPISEVTTYAWSPNGKQMIIGSDDGVYMVDFFQLFGEHFFDETECP